MSEAIITRAGMSKGGIEEVINNSLGITFMTEIFTTNTIWTVPAGIVDNIVSVMVYGGGGGGQNMAGNGLQGVCIVQYYKRGLKKKREGFLPLFI